MMSAQGDHISSPTVLVVAEGGDAGGIGRYCVDLAELMGERARLVCLCVDPCPDERACWLAAESAKRDIPLMRVHMPAKAWRAGLAGLVAAWKLHGRPIVHVNGRRGNAIAMVARLVVPGFRYVTTVHGVLGLHDRRNAIYRVVDLAAGRLATAVIAVSADTRRRLLKAGTPDTRIVVVPNGLAATELAALRAVAARREPRGDGIGGRGQPLRVGFLGRLSPEKGTRELIEACQRLHGSNAPVTVAIAGDGPDLEWMVRQSGPMVDQGFLQFVGEVRDVPAFLGAVDVLAMPSHNEGMPYVLLEAMAAGCAVVAFDVGGIGEVIRTEFARDPRTPTRCRRLGDGPSTPRRRARDDRRHRAERGRGHGGRVRP